MISFCSFFLPHSSMSNQKSNKINFKNYSIFFIFPIWHNYIQAETNNNIQAKVFLAGCLFAKIKRMGCLVFCMSIRRFLVTFLVSSMEHCMSPSFRWFCHGIRSFRLDGQRFWLRLSQQCMAIWGRRRKEKEKKISLKNYVR